jgi:hypothetical protein
MSQQDAATCLAVLQALASSTSAVLQAKLVNHDAALTLALLLLLSSHGLPVTRLGFPVHGQHCAELRACRGGHRQWDTDVVISVNGACEGC